MNNSSPKRSHITLIQPPTLIAKYNYSTLTQAPLGIAYLASFLRKNDHDVKIIDAVGLSIDQYSDWEDNNDFLMQGMSLEGVLGLIPQHTNVIGISCMFTHAWPLTRKLVSLIRLNFPEKLIVLGGEHATALYEEVLKESSIDLVILGEGEETLEEIARNHNLKKSLAHISGIAYKKINAIVKNSRRKRITDLNQIPWPAWDLVDPLVYSKKKVYAGPNYQNQITIPMLLSRGCPYQCTFCSSPNMWTTQWCARSVLDACDEIEHYINILKASDFQIQDLTAIVNKQEIKNFCLEIIKRRLKISWQITVGTRAEAIDNEVCDLLVKSGCKHIQFALESGSDEQLMAIKKRLNKSDLKNAIFSALKLKMNVSVCAIIGFPNEILEDMIKTKNEMLRMAIWGVHEVAISNFIPLPATDIFFDLKNQNQININDEYYYAMSASTKLLNAKSYNPNITDRQLFRVKIISMIQFYLLSWILHPSYFFRIIKNLFLGKQETKVDRVIVELIKKFKVIIRLKTNTIFINWLKPLWK